MNGRTNALYEDAYRLEVHGSGTPALPREGSRST